MGTFLKVFLSFIVGAQQPASLSMADDYKTKDYYFATATRESASRVLKDAPSGSFILRPSSQKDAVAITIKEKDGGIQNALIKRTPDGQFSVQLSAVVTKTARSVVALLDSLTPHYLKPNPLQMGKVKKQLGGGGSSAGGIYQRFAGVVPNSNMSLSNMSGASMPSLPSTPSYNPSLGPSKMPLPPLAAAAPPVPQRSTSLNILTKVFQRPGAARPLPA